MSLTCRHNRQWCMNLSNSPSELSEHLSTQPPLNFDYGALDNEIRIIVQQHTSEIKSLMRRTAQDMIDIGQKLIEVKQQLGHGNFRNWLKAEFDWGIWTATKFIQVADRFRCVNFTHLNIAVSALYLLASPSTPKEARAEALERATLGENITCAKAKAIVSDHKQAIQSQPGKLVTLNIPAKAVKHNSGATVNPLNSATSISEDVSLELVEDTPDRIGEIEQQLPGKELATETRLLSLQGLVLSPASNSNTPTPARAEDLAVTTQGIPDAVTVEIAIGIKNLTPAQLALVIKASANNGLSDHHLEAVISAAQQALKQRHQPAYSH